MRSPLKILGNSLTCLFLHLIKLFVSYFAIGLVSFPFYLALSFIESAPLKLIAWSTCKYNKVRLVELETAQVIANFDGVKVRRRSRILLFFADFIEI